MAHHQVRQIDRGGFDQLSFVMRFVGGANFGLAFM